MSGVVKKIEQLRRTHVLAHNAFRRAMQYPGYETGRKAYERYEVYEARFQELCDEIGRAFVSDRQDKGQRKTS